MAEIRKCDVCGIMIDPKDHRVPFFTLVMKMYDKDYYKIYDLCSSCADVMWRKKAADEWHSFIDLGVIEDGYER